MCFVFGDRGEYDMNGWVLCTDANTDKRIDIRPADESEAFIGERSGRSE